MFFVCVLFINRVKALYFPVVYYSMWAGLRICEQVRVKWISLWCDFYQWWYSCWQRVFMVLQCDGLLLNILRCYLPVLWVGRWWLWCLPSMHMGVRQAFGQRCVRLMALNWFRLNRTTVRHSSMESRVRLVIFQPFIKLSFQLHLYWRDWAMSFQTATLFWL